MAKVLSGKPYPLGATLEASGVNFALFSAHAQKVELCLFSPDGTKELERISLPQKTNDIWHGFVPHLTQGCVYGYRVHGAYQPEQGHRFNPNKLVLDPYAKALVGELIEHPSLYGYQQHTAQDNSFDNQDSAPFMPKAVVCANSSTTQVEPLVHQTPIIYELHIKGFSQQHLSIKANYRGSYLALTQPQLIEHISSLGINTVELLPLQTFVDEPHLLEKQLTNYWGYNPLAWFVPTERYAENDAHQELKAMIQTLHQHNISVVLDVVFNHSAEGNELGRTLSFRGIDNASYYQLDAQNKRHYLNHSGCGNTMNINHPQVLQLVLDNLRYWVTAFGIDGFRFDLAPILARSAQGFDRQHAFFQAINQDPILSQVLLIAEPWDLAPDGYQLGKFPTNWLEWNDVFRDTCRAFWRGDNGLNGEFAHALTGSNKLFEYQGKPQKSSVNYITCHDGFTLTDLVSFEHKHNLANKEQNHDGNNLNFSANYGIEGITENTEINQLRFRQQVNLLTTLLLAQGTPMLRAGDELNHSQQGNNNAYCQDNDISYLPWSNQPSALSNIISKLIAFKQQQPLLNRSQYHHATQFHPQLKQADTLWFNHTGQPMQLTDWHSDYASFALILVATEHELSLHSCDALAIIFNANHSAITFNLPNWQGQWTQQLNTGANALFKQQLLTHPQLELIAKSCAVLSYQHPESTQAREQ